MAFKPATQTFGQKSYPPEMRRQLWALCCGASIISGFKSANELTEDELCADIEACVKSVPDMQVFAGEQLNPKFTFLTLNSGQMGSQKIISCIEKCGFFMIGVGAPRGGKQGFFLRDDTNSSWSPTGNTKTAKVTDINGAPLVKEAAAV